ncbi:MAG TPA: hypothetical protein VG125_01175 [Pirellulales bacterium]|jgi:hypothetical protein|nr:hypothetical protein [Pirellulales bacterium]
MRTRFFWWPAFALLLGCIAVLSVVMATRPGFPEAMEQVEGVSRVERLVSPRWPTCRIIHIADYRWLTHDDFEADLREQDPDATDADIDGKYEATLATVREVQANQLRLIHWLAKEQGVRTVYLEGLNAGNWTAYMAMISWISRGSLDPMRVGAAGQAILAGDIETVAPAEEESPHRAADPLTVLAGEGVVLGALEGPANDAREEAIARRLAASGPLAVVVLGQGHDLSRHVEKLGNCEYLKVYVRGTGN